MTKAIIVPIGTRMERENKWLDDYRGISMLRSLGKIYSPCHTVIEESSENQYTYTKEKKEENACINFKKSFDYVGRSKLWQLSFSSGLKDKTLQAIMSIYRKVFCVRPRLGNTSFCVFTVNVICTECHSRNG